MSKLIFAAFLTMLAGCGPSCEERGGSTVLSHYQPVMVMAGNVPGVQVIPIYDCKMPEQAQTKEGGK